VQSRLVKIYKQLLGVFGPQGWWPGRTPLEISVGAILTQNTNWSNVARAMHALRQAGCLSFAALKAVPERKLARLIRPAGYFNMKARRLKHFIRYLDRRYGGNFSRMRRRSLKALRQELLAVNGIGPETADSILLYALKKPVFVVDAYTKRILSRHGIVKEDADYARLQSVFLENLPAKEPLFNEYHALIVRLGKDFCKKTGPRCGVCPLKNETQRPGLLVSIFPQKK